MNKWIVEAYYEYKLNGVDVVMQCVDDPTQFSLFKFNSFANMIFAFYLIAYSTSC